jgi:hypothetical protein
MTLDRQPTRTIANNLRRAFGSPFPLLLGAVVAHLGTCLAWLFGLQASHVKEKTTLARLLDRIDVNVALLMLAAASILVLVKSSENGGKLPAQVVACLCVAGGLASMWAFDVVLGVLYLGAGVELFRHLRKRGD